MKRYGPALLISLLLHAGLLLLAYISWSVAPKVVTTSAVAVELVSSVPQHEMAEAPVDELAVKTPSPEPAPEEPVKEPEPIPAPKLPVPAPQKAATPAKPEKKPDPPKKAQATPDKNGAKAPTPDKKAKPAAENDFLNRLAAAPSKAPTRKTAVANTHSTSGSSIRGAAPADSGTIAALDALTRRLARLWNPNCDVVGGKEVVVNLDFTLSPNGRVIKGPDWSNPRSDNVWVAGSNRAKAAVSQGAPYTDLPPELYNVPLRIVFDATKACR